MGCTSSSTPKMHSASASIEAQFEDNAEETYKKHLETIDTDNKNRTEIKVLPPSDATEPVQLVMNKSTSLEPEKDLNTNESEHSDTSETTTNTNNEEKDDSLSKLKLEEVVGKFFEISHQDMKYDIDAAEPNNGVTTEKDNIETDVEVETEHKDDDEHEHHTNSEEAEDASPSQSQSSRATRWEALADIAAELPPSLAVDPITGQIYSLSK